jgi:enoyl-CoA hydratase
MPSEFLLLGVDDRVATVTINRPDKLNALNEQVIRELGETFTELGARDDVGAIILTGAGRAFVAGADIAALAGASAADLAALSAYGGRIFRSIEQLRKPVIAAVNGFAFGGGFEVALSCHLRVASEKAVFGLPEVKLGLIPGYGGTQRLSRLIGRGPALQMILTGDPVDAGEAHRLGIANMVVPPEELLASTTKLAATMLKNGPLALACALEAVDRGLDVPLDEANALESRLFGSLGDTADMREGTKAFLEKRPAVFRGK